VNLANIAAYVVARIVRVQLSAQTSGGLQFIAQSKRMTAMAHNVGGTWHLSQSNGITVNVNLTQDGSGKLTGSASFHSVSGTCEGSIVNDSFFLSVAWSGGKFGEYNGFFGNVFSGFHGERRLWGVV